MKPILGMPQFRPMLASIAEKPFDDESYVFEIKWDGYRCLLYLRRGESGGDSHLLSRNGKDLGKEFPELRALWSRLKGRSAVVDGEIVVMAGGRPDFAALRKHQGVPAFVAFDILHLDGKDLREMPLVKRRDCLRDSLEFAGGLVFSEGVRGNGTGLFSLVKDRDLEGIVAKHILSPYLSGRRSRYWLKVRNAKERWFSVLGYRRTPGMRIGAVVVGDEEEGRVMIRGAVSSGLGTEEERQLLALLHPVADGGLRTGEYRNVTWVRPGVRVLVSYTEMTADGRLRHPVLRSIGK